MEIDNIQKMLVIFVGAEKGLDMRSPEFDSMPKEAIEFYFNLLDDEFGFIKKFYDSNESPKYRITAKGYETFKRMNKDQNTIGF